jgi:hypothetical protein
MHPHDTDRQRFEDGRRTPDMVEMRVGDHEQVEPIDAFTPEMPHDVRVRLAGVDEDIRSLRTEQERITLADIQSGQGERHVRGRDAARCGPSRDAPGEQQDKDE